MKNVKVLFLLWTLAMTVSCAMESKNAVTPPMITESTTAAYVPTVVAPGYDPGYLYGGTVTLVPESGATMADFAGHQFNNLQNFTINLNMVKTSGGTFGGTLTMTYTDYPYSYTTYFTAGSTAQSTIYNRSFTVDGKVVWHGVFEDYKGGLVVVFDELVNLGDGQGYQDTVNGSVWYKNYSTIGTGPHPNVYCWFIYHPLGPYDCRPWPEGTGMNTYASRDPLGGYKKLGTFTGLSLAKALNGQTL